MENHTGFPEKMSCNEKFNDEHNTISILTLSGFSLFLTPWGETE